MRALVVRNNGTLVCFGPQNGMYAPQLKLDDVQSDEDYDLVLAEAAATKPPSIDREALKAQLSAATTIAALKPILLQLL